MGVPPVRLRQRPFSSFQRIATRRQNLRRQLPKGNMSQAKLSAVLREGLIDSFPADRLRIHLYKSKQHLNAAAAAALALEIHRLVEDRRRAIGIFSSEPSHEGFLAELVKIPGAEWTRVVGFHLNEYLGMDENAPQSLRKFLLDRLVRQVPMAEFHGLRGEAANPAAVCANYSALLKSRPPDFAALGIGENGRLGFIGPSVCDFHDPQDVRNVELDEVCRRRHIHDGAFATIDETPRRGISLTVPALMRCPRLFIMAPGVKDRALCHVIESEISRVCPASILRTHPNAQLFIDRDAGL
jgi:glucosamine-6-phosphate deaminase